MRSWHEVIWRERVEPGRTMGSQNDHAGAFQFGPLRVIASDGDGWEHVSVSRVDRTPTWEEMCQIKELFFGDEETVVQFHPKKSEYVNNHRFCLHLWQPLQQTLPTPPEILVGIRKLGLCDGLSGGGISGEEAAVIQELAAGALESERD